MEMDVKKIIDYLTSSGINIFVLIIFSVLIFYASTSYSYDRAIDICNSYSFSENTQNKIITDKNYNDFLIHYYETQSEWLNKWLTALGILLGVAGIGIPLLLNTSYKSKIEEMTCEFEKKIIEVNQLNITAEQTIENLNNKIEKSVENTEKELSKIKNDYDKKLEDFNNKMLEAINEAKISSILLDIKSLSDEAERHKRRNEMNNELDKYNKIINIARDALIKYKANKVFYSTVLEKLEHIYFLRALLYMYDKNDMKRAIVDFKKIESINKMKNEELDYTIKICLLKCYVVDGQIEKSEEIINTITEITKEDLKLPACTGENLIDYLKEHNENGIASDLIAKLEEIIID